MRVFLTTAYQQGVALRFLREASEADRFRVHEVVDRPEQADVILFVENGELNDRFYRQLLRHPLVRSEPDRVFMYNEWDFPYPVLRGLYCSMPQRAFDPDKQAAFGYLFKPNEFIAGIADSDIKPDLLYSFAGARNHPVRNRVLKLKDARAHVEDTHAFSIWMRNDPTELLRRKRTYADVIARSKFVLCPRGAGTSSYRLFETLEAARAPVIISDQWVPPTGPDWSFLVRVPESKIGQLPDILRERESEARDRGRAARAAWESFFAPDVVFHRGMQLLATLKERPLRQSLRDQLPHPEYVRLRAQFALLGGARAGRDFVRGLLRKQPQT